MLPDISPKVSRRVSAHPRRSVEYVLDPFCGCATTLEAAERLKRRWIGIDIAFHAIRRVGGIHLTGVTICSVHGVSSRWQALPGLGWRVSSLVSNRCGLPGLPRMAAVARRLRLSELRPRRRLALGRWPLHVSGVFDTQFGDGRYDLRSDADTLDDMVHRLLAVRHR